MNDTEYIEEAYSEILGITNSRDYPVGAIIVINDKIISRANNTVAEEHDPTAHAEINAIRIACKKLKCHKLKGARLYTTLYPCPMCEAAIVEAGIEDVVFGADSFKWVRDVKFAKGKVKLIGPILNNKCRSIFEEKLKDLGREDILNYENS